MSAHDTLRTHAPKWTVDNCPQDQERHKIRLEIIRAAVIEWDALTAEAERLKAEDKYFCSENERVSQLAEVALSESRQSSRNASAIAAERDAALAQLAAEKARADVFRAVLISAEYDDVDDLPARGLKFAWRLGTTTVERTEAEKARADRAEYDQGLAAVDCAKWNEAAVAEKARADEAERKLAEVCPEDHVCASDGWSPCDAEPKWCDEHRLNAADKRDHAIAEAARDLVRQIEIGEYVEQEGHNLKMNAKYLAVVASVEANK